MQRIALADIRIDGGTQSRVELHQDAISDYAELLSGDTAFPAVIVFDDGAAKWLADGFHRYHAYLKAGKSLIECDVRQGTLRDAILFAVGANAEHGLKRTPEDKRKAVRMLINDEEWAKWSDREIAKACKVSQPFVGKLRPCQKEKGENVFTFSADGKKKKGKRKYKTSTGKTAEMTVVVNAPAEEPEAEPPAPTDKFGNPIAGTVAEAFAVLDQFKEMDGLVKQLATIINEVATHPGASWFRRGLGRRQPKDKVIYFSADLENLRSNLRSTRPHYGRCPWCEDRHPGEVDPKCTGCFGNGWIPEEVYKRCKWAHQEPEAEKAAS